MIHYLKIIALAAVLGASVMNATAGSKGQLAETILADQNLLKVKQLAEEVISQGLNAGSGYSQIWARDMNTFIETALEQGNTSHLREAILLFFKLQQPNGEMIDGYVLKPDFTWYDNHPYYSDAAPEHVAFKNTVETDQESSLMQIVGKYVQHTGDTELLQHNVAGHTVLERIDMMIDYLMRERYSEQYGLFWGAMTADWGDVQPGEGFQCDINEQTTPAIDVYDNAMMIIALRSLEQVVSDKTITTRWAKLRKQLHRNVRKHLWDSKNQKFIPHIYLNGSPIPEGFDENQVHYHGGTAVAIEAGLLSKKEIAIVNSQMLRNVQLSGMPSIGLTIYPPYPEGVFGGGMSQAYNYQNGGDWTWFGARMIQQLAAHSMVQEAYDEVQPMIERVIANKGFYEWYGKGNVPSGSGHFKGSAGTLHKAIVMLRKWAQDNAPKQ
ncbi:MAG: hypothetical protein ACI308_05475 [Muribaculaceae bacterium]